MSAPGLEIFPYDEPAIQLEPVLLPAEQRKESIKRALFLVETTPISLAKQPEMHARREQIHKTAFNRRNGTLILGLNKNKLLPRLIDRPYLQELRDNGFRPKDELHITVLGYENGERIIRALDGQVKKLGAVASEAEQIDWSWQPTGKFYPFQGRRGGSLKLVTLVDCPGAKVFYDRLEEEIDGLQLERHPMHITVMKKPGEYTRHGSISIGGIALSHPLRTLNNLSIA